MMSILENNVKIVVKIVQTHVPWMENVKIKQVIVKEVYILGKNVINHVQKLMIPV
jgi:hypothetical protein